MVVISFSIVVVYFAMWIIYESGINCVGPVQELDLVSFPCLLSILGGMCVCETNPIPRQHTAIIITDRSTTTSRGIHDSGVIIGG